MWLLEDARNYNDQKSISGKKLCCTCYKELDLLLDSDILVDGDAIYEVYLDERLNKVISSFRLYTINKH